MMIPPQLQSDRFRLIKVAAKGKKPIESGWTTLSNYKPTDEEITTWINDGNNYGVATGFGNLIVIDSDNAVLQEQIDRTLPQSFQVKTGGGGYHNYFICAELSQNNCKKIFEKDGVHLGELQTQGQQVIGPGCTHPNGNKYTLTKDLPITPITQADVDKAFPSDWIKGNKKETPQKGEYQSGVKHNLSIIEVVPMGGLSKTGNGEYQGEHPVHGSETGQNFCINPAKNVWHCFRHDCGGDPLSWIAIQEGIINCGDKLDGENFKKTLSIAKLKHGLVEYVSKKEGETLDALRDQVLQYLSEDPPDRNNASEEVVNWIKEKHNLFTIRDDRAEEIWIYQDGIYVPNGITYIKEICRDVLRTGYTTGFANRVVQKIQADTYTDQLSFFQRRNKDSIAVQNGYLNIFTRELRPYNPEEIFFEKLPVTYDPQADCPKFKQHLHDVLKHDSDFDLMSEVIGHLLYNDYRYETAVMLSGDGENGKGKTCNAIIKFLGEDNVSGISLEAICEESFSRGELLNKRANICGEVNNKIIDNSEWFKKLTGRDYVSANRKGLPYVKFYNNAKFIFNLNEIPPTKDQTDGFFRRWIIIEFPYKFLPEDQIAKLPDKEKVWAKKRDTRQGEKLTTQAELNGILNFALDGVQRLEAHDKFSYSKSIDEVRQMWIRKSNSFEAFCLEFVAEDSDSQIPKDQFRQEYAQFCKRHKLRSVSDTSIKITLTNKYGASDKYPRIGQDRVWVWVGIRLKESTIPGEGGEGGEGVSTSIEKKLFSLGDLNTPHQLDHLHQTPHIKPHCEKLENGLDGLCEVCGGRSWREFSVEGRIVCRRCYDEYIPAVEGG